MIGYTLFLDILAKVFLALGVVTALICVVDWAIRTRKISPFSAIARFFRQVIDPLLRPLEGRIVRLGGQPQSAPLWAFVAVIVSGIVVLQLLGLVGELLMQAATAASNPSMLPRLLAGWALQFLYVALLVRVFSSWMPISPYSRWIRWSYVSTEWLLAPLRRLIPPFGPLDLSPLAALGLIWLAGRIIGV